MRNCLHCGRSYVSEVPSKLYCAPRCATNAQRKRARERAGAAESLGYIATRIYNPSAMQLASLAERYTQGLVHQPTQVVGKIPVWKAPSGINFMRNEDGSWTMWAGVDLENDPDIKKLREITLANSVQDGPSEAPKAKPTIDELFAAMDSGVVAQQPEELL